MNNNDLSQLYGEKLEYKYLPNNIAEALINTAKKYPNKGVYVIGNNGIKAQVTYPALLRKAREVAKLLSSNNVKNGDPVLISMQDIEKYFYCFWGVIFANAIPVPVSSPRAVDVKDKSLQDMLSLIDRFEGAYIISDFYGQQDFRNLILQNSQWDAAFIDIDASSKFYSSNIDEVKLMIGPDDVAVFLQTSGSTGAPKIVPQTHARLLKRSIATVAVNSFDDSDISLNCFPLDHVCGLVMFHIRDVYIGSDQYHASIDEMLANPLNYLAWIDKYKITSTWSPNFIFNLIYSRRKELPEYKLNLRSLRFWENCAEPIVASHVKLCVDLLREYGLKEDIIYPAWGMSETCSVMVLSNSLGKFQDTTAQQYVVVGKPYPNCGLKIVDEYGNIVKIGIIGELLVTGDYVFDGYYKHDNTSSFSKDLWFDTGDLAKIVNNELVIVGRSKDIIIVNGLKIGNHEIEQSIEQVKGIIASNSVVVSVNQDSPEERIAVFVCLAENSPSQVEIATAICSHIIQVYGFSPDYIVFLDTIDIPRTSVGKLQRQKLKKEFELGNFKPHYVNPRVKKIECFKPTWLIRTPQSKIHNFVNTIMICDDENPDNYILSKHASDSKINILSDESELQNLTSINNDVSIILIKNTVKDIVTESVALKKITKIITKLLKHCASRQLNIKSIIVVHLKGFSILDGDMLSQDLNLSLSALLRSVQAEHINVMCKSIFINNNEQQDFRNILCFELLDNFERPEVAYYNNHRYVLGLTSMSSMVSNDIQRGSGASLIFGGLGGIGEHLVRHLMQMQKHTIYICGRTPLEQFDNATMQRFKRLKTLYGHTIIYKSIDVCDMQAVNNLFNELVIKGTIDTVYNLTGAAREGVLLEVEDYDIDYHLNVKLIGTYNIYQAANLNKVPSLINFNSINGFFGGTSYGLYSLANNVQSSIADYLNCNNGDTVVYNLSWSMWDDVGISKGFEYKQYTQMKGYDILDPLDATQILEKIVNKQRTNILIGLNPENENIRQYILNAKPATSVVPRKENITNNNVLSNDKVVEKLSKIWKDSGVKSINSESNIFEAGTTSIMVPQILNKINTEFGITLKLTDFFKFPRIHLLAQHIKSSIKYETV